MQDGAGLLFHVRPEQSFIKDEVSRVRHAYGMPLAQTRGREAATQISRLAYDGMRRHRFGFEVQLYNLEPGAEVIRTPAQIEYHRTANCLDLACLFAGIREAAGQAPIVIVIDGPAFAHALVGVRMPGEPLWSNPQHGDLRRALSLGDAVFFEPTGVVEVDSPVAAETSDERQDKLLDFMTAKLAAERMLVRNDIRIRHVLHVKALRHPSN